MVTYRYSCEKCGYEFDFDQRITDPPKKRCPKCRGSVYRVIQAVGHILKGGGFYRTENRSKDFSAKEKEETASAASSKTIDSKKPKENKEKK
jgi:putative FmdB family regulatory protein